MANVRRMRGSKGRCVLLQPLPALRFSHAREAIRTLLAAYAILFDGEALFRDRLARLRAEMGEEPHVRTILDFIDAGRNRPLLQPLQKDAAALGETGLLEAGA